MPRSSYRGVCRTHSTLKQNCLVCHSWIVFLRFRSHRLRCVAVPRVVLRIVNETLTHTTRIRHTYCGVLRRKWRATPRHTASSHSAPLVSCYKSIWRKRHRQQSKSSARGVLRAYFDAWPIVTFWDYSVTLGLMIVMLCGPLFCLVCNDIIDSRVWRQRKARWRHSETYLSRCLQDTFKDTS